MLSPFIGDKLVKMKQDFNFLLALDRFHELPWKFSAPPFPRPLASYTMSPSINVKEQIPKATWCSPVVRLGGPSLPSRLRLTGYFHWHYFHFHSGFLASSDTSKLGSHLLKSRVRFSPKKVGLCSLEEQVVKFLWGTCRTMEKRRRKAAKFPLLPLSCIGCSTAQFL